MDEGLQPDHSEQWQNRLESLAERALGEQRGQQLVQKYRKSFSADYRLLVSPRYALNDILQVEHLSSSNDIRVSLIRPHPKQPDYRLHFYSMREHYLDEFIPVLENMSLRVVDQIQFSFNIDDSVAAVKSFTIKAAKSQCAPFALLGIRLLETIQAVMAYRVENDGLNKLCVLAGLSWQEIDVLRAYRNYYLQLGHRTTQASLHHALINNPKVALGLFKYFEARFKPNPEWQDSLTREEQALSPTRMELQEHIDSVEDIHDDRILRTIFNLIDATVRTSFYLRRSLDNYFISFKINSLGIIDMPLPKPQWEIYVHAADMEGIHLRAGKVSRGGIRWSDRPDDFRTEILDLMQTQVNKNALIIPTGAKGGFVVKSNGSRLDFKEAGKQAYIRLIHGLLDLTDNFQNDGILSPEGLVIYDDPDPYLVVAADKGTAKFSDLANSIAADYGFWLGDAFASGGTRGYDHKALGITARGAWECIKRHFLELGKDIQQERFTVIGIGSMDGDVFGNGMLLSPSICLQAAISGQHIFVDPNPRDLQAAFSERKRLFELSGSTWNDYDRNLISEGGGVFLRTDKNIPVSAVLKKWLGIRYLSIDGESLIRYLLTAEVELLWLGGIGTYVKASTEKHEEVGDRGNDHVRIDASELKAKVVGEGANLGFTQKARIEFNLRGGRINTDAVDNSAGVDTSDHEVNLKILLTHLHKKQLIDDYQALFVEMTGSVSRLVLADNLKQSLCLSLDQLRCADNPVLFQQVADRLEGAGFLDRVIESFADTKEIQARQGQMISRPELADLMAASKRYLTHQLQTHSLMLQTDFYDRYLEAYFPDQLCLAFKEHLNKHPLAKEIKATVISNKIINQAGCSFLGLISSNDNGAVIAMVDCYLAFELILEADRLRHEITNLFGHSPVDLQYRLLIQIEQALGEFCWWSVDYGTTIQPMAETISQYQKHWSVYKDHVQSYIARHNPGQINQNHQAGLPDALVHTLGALVKIQDFPFAVCLMHETQKDFLHILQLLDDINTSLGLHEVHTYLSDIPFRDAWERKVASHLLREMQHYTGLLLKQILSSYAHTCLDYFGLSEKQQHLNAYLRVYREVRNSAPNTLLPYVILIKALADISG